MFQFSEIEWNDSNFEEKEHFDFHKKFKNSFSTEIQRVWKTPNELTSWKEVSVVI